MARDHIALVGAMGSGKTTIGALLAESLSRPFVDSDGQIEATYGATGRELAERMGVPCLHEAEAAAFSKALESTDPTVIAAAASIADRPELVAMMKSDDVFVVLLEAELGVLAGRAERGYHRRRFDWDNMSDRMGHRRARLAAVADVVISTSSAAPAAVVAEVLGVLATRR